MDCALTLNSTLFSPTGIGLGCDDCASVVTTSPSAPRPEEAARRRRRGRKARILVRGQPILPAASSAARSLLDWLKSVEEERKQHLMHLLLS